MVVYSPMEELQYAYQQRDHHRARYEYVKQELLNAMHQHELNLGSSVHVRPWRTLMEELVDRVDKFEQQQHLIHTLEATLGVPSRDGKRQLRIDDVFRVFR